MSYQIDTSIPMPSKSDQGLVATVKRMQVGQSLVIKTTSISALYIMGERDGFKFVTSKSKEHAPLGHTRVWLKERPAA